MKKIKWRNSSKNKFSIEKLDQTWVVQVGELKWLPSSSSFSWRSSDDVVVGGNLGGPQHSSAILHPLTETFNQ